MTDSGRLTVVTGVFLCGLLGWTAAGYPGAGIGVTLGLVLLVMPWWRQPLWSWATLYLRRQRPIEFADPVTLANDRSSGGVRFQDDVAVTALALLGKPHCLTLVAGSMTSTSNAMNISELRSLMSQALGLKIESMSVISTGSRRGSLGDFPRVYDTLIGTAPYAGRRETWLIVRIRSSASGDALQCRDTVGTASLAAAQRIAATLRCSGIRAKVATATEMLELEKRLGRNYLATRNRHWRGVRGDPGWHSTYAYRPTDVSSEVLAQAWSLPADTITQNLTMFPDGDVMATVTVHTAQPATVSPSAVLQTLPGRQASALAAHLCGPRPDIRGVGQGPLLRPVVIPLGPSGVLLGRSFTGDRVLLPLGDPGRPSRVHIGADDAIAKRVILRAAGTGERITVHTSAIARWESIRMPNVVVTEQPRPVPGTTLSVVDGTVQVTPRPSTVISVSPPDTGGAAAEVVIMQTAPTTISVTAGGMVHQVEVEFFRAENRYVWDRSSQARPELVTAD